MIKLMKEITDVDYQVLQTVRIQSQRRQSPLKIKSNLMYEDLLKIVQQGSTKRPVSTIRTSVARIKAVV